MAKMIRFVLNSLQNDKILDWSTLRAFPDDNSTVAYVRELFFEREENIMSKAENTGYQHFLLSPLMYCQAISLRLIKTKGLHDKSIMLTIHI